MTDYKKIVEQVYLATKNGEIKGHLPNYIPELAKVNADSFGVFVTPVYKETFGIGNYAEKFSIQSIAKVISLCLAFKMYGESIWERLGVEPSGNSFNSLVQLENDKGVPRNPFINAGALVICDLLISHFNHPQDELLSFVRDIADNCSIDYNETIANSEKMAGFRNIALCNFIKSFGNIKNDPSVVLDFYFSLCSIEMSCQELSLTFSFLANAGKKLSDKKEILNSSQAKRINALMMTCGFYDESGEFAFKVGLPGKSGVGGGIVAIHPDKYSIAVWSPLLNEKGNSYLGMKFLERFTTETQLSVF